LAIVEGSESGVKYLLGKGADPHFEDMTGSDSCDYAKKHQVFMTYPVFQ
jgi:hypothetical protein